MQKWLLHDFVLGEGVAVVETDESALAFGYDLYRLGGVVYAADGFACQVLNSSQFCIFHRSRHITDN